MAEYADQAALFLVEFVDSKSHWPKLDLVGKSFSLKLDLNQGEATASGAGGDSKVVGGYSTNFALLHLSSQSAQRDSSADLLQFYGKKDVALLLTNSTGGVIPEFHDQVVELMTFAVPKVSRAEVNTADYKSISVKVLDQFGNPIIYYRGTITEEQNVNADGEEEQIGILKEDIRKLLDE